MKSKQIFLEEKLYTVKETAERLRVSERTIFRYIYEGKLSASKIGSWRIDHSAITGFLMRSTFEKLKTDILEKRKNKENVKKKTK